jgi:hypothetical protein
MSWKALSPDPFQRALSDLSKYIFAHIFEVILNKDINYEVAQKNENIKSRGC